MALVKVQKINSLYTVQENEVHLVYKKREINQDMCAFVVFIQCTWKDSKKDIPFHLLSPATRIMWSELTRGVQTKPIRAV